jgi:hypothetical protein
VTRRNGLIRLSLTAGAALLAAGCGAAPSLTGAGAGAGAGPPRPIPATVVTAKAPLLCEAWVNHPRPADHTKVGVHVRTAPHARVRTAVHYRTTVATKIRQANDLGDRANWYNIGGATPGFRVIVKVRTSRHGRQGHCQTSFTPRGAAPGPGPSPTPTPTPVPGLSCSASMSSGSPAQYTHDDVNVTTAPGAPVSATAHYKTTDTTHSGTADSGGKAVIDYYISGATIGYKVVVDVTVSLNSQTADCSTSFTPAS